LQSIPAPALVGTLIQILPNLAISHLDVGNHSHLFCDFTSHDSLHPRAFLL